MRKSRYYLMKCLGFVLLFGFISLGAIGGCSNNNSGGQATTSATTALTENDFGTDLGLVANLEKHLIVKFLEHPSSEEAAPDTGEVGNDVIPVTYTRTLEHTFCWEDDDPEAGHFMEFDDSDGNLIFRLDVNGECITEIIEAGDYVMTIHHDGRIETTYPIFLIPNPEDIQQAKETNGLINRFKVVIANILQNIQNTVSKDARAQTVQDNINTLISTNNCPSCNLFKADLSNRVLNGVYLFKSSLRFANLSNSKLQNASFRGADLGFANLSGKDTDLSNANFLFANLLEAKLIDANLSGAQLDFAYAYGANLTGANLIGVELGRTILTAATWCDGKCICQELNPTTHVLSSIGFCVGCPPQDTCTGP